MINLVLPTLDKNLSPEIKDKLKQDFIQTDKAMLILSALLFFVVAAVTSNTYDTYKLGILGGGILLILSFLAYKFYAGTVISRAIYGISFMSYTSIMITQQMGVIEFHFPFFILVAALAAYKDIVAILAATIVAAVYHLLFTYLQLSGLTVLGFEVLIFNHACTWGYAFLHIIMFAIEVAILTYVVMSAVKQFTAANKLQIESEKNYNKLHAINLENKKIIDSTIEVAQSVNNGILTKRVQGDTSDENIKALKEIINDMMNNLENKISPDLNEIMTILNEYSNDNFMNKALSKGELSNNLNKLCDGITKTLTQNKDNGTTLQDYASTLLTNVDHLNAASNNTATSLEETAAAIEEITSITRSNGEKIFKMLEISKDLNSSAKNGEKLAANTTEAMDDINTQVHSINDAITVIDQIAFQTNILSLNAAVEAATAGEAGKGFAVVAAEVRNLANRSAEAAKEIKNIVELATKKASEGKLIANDMINDYSKLNDKVAETLHLINDITTASKEQESGIIQINTTVNALDTQTQNNASVATQTNEIAIKTEDIAKIILESANEKKFKG